MISTRTTDTTRANQTARAVRIAGMWIVAKARQQARDQGTQQAARNLRKQGAPIEHALAILGGGA